jgi:putative thioredoxin
VTVVAGVAGRRGAAVPAGVVRDPAVVAALEVARAHHHVSPGRGEAVQEHDGVPLPRLLAGQRDAAGIDRQVGHARYVYLNAGYPRRVIFDTTEATFEQDVLERSHEMPVVVDFWAEWCAPCRQLTPVLEKGVRQRAGKIALAKLDTDANQQLAAAFRIQGIPAVKAFVDGRVAAEFVGAQPPATVEQFLDSLLPSEADSLVEAGDESALRRALELEPNRADAAVALAHMLRDRGESAAALEVLGNVAGSFAADGLAARIRLESDPELRDAFAALDAGELQRGLDALIDAIAAANGDGERREDLRRAVVGVLDDLGVEHPLARESRRKLASALY